MLIFFWLFRLFVFIRGKSRFFFREIECLIKINGDFLLAAVSNHKEESFHRQNADILTEICRIRA